MAVISRHLRRCLVRNHFASHGSTRNLERCLPLLSGMRPEACEVEHFSTSLDRSGEAAVDRATGGGNFPSSTINPRVLGNALDQRYDMVGTISPDLNILRSSQTSVASSNFVSPEMSVHRGNGSRHFKPRHFYVNTFPFHTRSLSAAVSFEDKLRQDAEDEDFASDSREDAAGSIDGNTKPNKVLKESDSTAKAGEAAENLIYTSASASSDLSPADINKFINLSGKDQEQYFGEGFPAGFVKEFDDTKERALLVRARVLQLLNRFETSRADMVRFKEAQERGESVRFFPSKPRQCLLEGLVKGGKSAALLMLVHWARCQGWLVFYVPNGREWTSGGMYFKNAQTGLYDTPIQAKAALEGFLRSHEATLGKLQCRILKPLDLGEGAGLGKVRGSQQITLPDGATLRDLVERGTTQSHAAVSCLVRLREELNLVQEVPVLIVVDEFNTWFTFSGYHESTGARSRRPIHAGELSLVNAFRSMEGPLMMAAAFSHSLAIGKLPVQLPGLPKGVRFSIPRYTLEEATAALKYYHSRKIVHRMPTDEDIKKLFYLTNGNGDELRNLVRLL